MTVPSVCWTALSLGVDNCVERTFPALGAHIGDGVRVRFRPILRSYEKLIEQHPKSYYSRQARGQLKKLDELQKEAEKPPEPAPKPAESKKK